MEVLKPLGALLATPGALIAFSENFYPNEQGAHIAPRTP